MPQQTWILAGQSNMQGAGKMHFAPPAHPKITMFSIAGNWEAAEEPLHPLWESYLPVHQNFMRQHLSEDDKKLSDAELAARAREQGWAVGPGMSFAHEMVALSGDDIALIPCAHGGTCLNDWNFNRKAEGGTSLYGALFDRIERSGAEVSGVLWYQGESDCNNQGAGSYAERFEAWIRSLRRDLGKDVPVVVVQLGRLVIPPSGGPEAQWNLVRDAQCEVAEKLDGVTLVSALDLGLTDTIHIDGAGTNRLGKRLATVAHRLMQGEKVAAPRVQKVELVEKNQWFCRLVVRCAGVTGTWNPAWNIAGFSLRDENGAVGEKNLLLDASRDRDNPCDISVLFSGEPAEGLKLAYGWGCNPVVNARDEADLPLPSFSSLPIEISDGIGDALRPDQQRFL